MSIKTETPETREFILQSLHTRVRNAEAKAYEIRGEMRTNEDSQYEAQARKFMEAVASQKVGDEIYNVYKYVADQPLALPALEEMAEEFNTMVFEFGGRMPSDPAGRAFNELVHLGMIEATKFLRSVIKGVKAHEAK